jgi:hypothetical protein
MEKNMTEFKRWYDEDPIVTKCITLLEGLDNRLKHQTATFLMTQIVHTQPYSDMLDEKVFEIATGETKRRRWYDYDEIVRILVELMRYSTPEIRKLTAIKAISFVEDVLAEDTSPNSIAIEDAEDENILIPDEEKGETE